MNITNSNLPSRFVQHTCEKPTRIRDRSNAREYVESEFYRQGHVSRHPSRSYIRLVSRSSSPSAKESQRQESEEGGGRNPLSKYIQ